MRTVPWTRSPSPGLGRKPDSLPTTDGHAVDSNMAVEPAMRKVRRDLAGCRRQHAPAEPGVQVLETVRGLVSRFRGHVRHLDAKPLTGMAEIPGRALHSLDRVRPWLGQMDGDSDGEQLHPDGEMQARRVSYRSSTGAAAERQYRGLRCTGAARTGGMLREIGSRTSGWDV